MRENIQRNTIRNEKGYMTTDTKEIHIILRASHRNLYSTKLGNIKEKDNFLARHHLPKSNKAYVSNFNRNRSCHEKQTIYPRAK